MEEVHADVIVPATPKQAFVVVSNLKDADWLPAVKGLKHVGGPKTGVGAKYDVEVGLIGKHLRGTLACTEMDAPSRFVLTLEDGIKLTITVTVSAVSGGSKIELLARYGVPGFTGKAVEKAAAPVARREAARAVEALAAKFGRRAGPAVST